MPNYQPRDTFYKKARAAGLPSRASFKLDEILRKYRLISPGGRVVDLGCAPGGWMAILAPAVGPTGVVVGVDLVSCRPQAPWAGAIVGDATDPEVWRDARRLLGAPADLVTSDMAPRLTGVAARDSARSVELIDAALEFGRMALRTGGSMVVKLFMNSEFKAVIGRFDAAFRRVEVMRTKASRPGSAELYLIARSRSEG